MRILTTLLLCVILVSTSLAQTNGPTRRASFESIVARAVAQYPNGERLYKRCDLFSRLVNEYAWGQVGITREKPLSNGQSGGPLLDTSKVLDVSRTAFDE